MKAHAFIQLHSVYQECGVGNWPVDTTGILSRERCCAPNPSGEDNRRFSSAVTRFFSFYYGICQPIYEYSISCLQC